MKLKYIIPVSLSLAIAMGSCTQEYLNPNSPTKDVVLASQDGLLGLVVGTKQVWATGPQYHSVICNGLSSKELTVLNTGNGELAALETGKTNVGAANTVVASLFSGCHLVKSYAQQLIDNASNIGDPVVQTGVRAYGHYLKALAIGTMAQYWEQVSTEAISSAEYQNGKRAAFKPRAAALDEAIALLRAANDLIKATPISSNTVLTSKIGNDLDLANAIPALIARYSLMNGKNDDALTFANAVDLTKKPFWKYDAVNPNPVYRQALASNNVVGGIANFGLSGSLLPDSTDGRIAFYLGSATLSKATGFFKADADVIPAYLPSEMTLIKAEALARQDKVPDAIIELNKILQKTADPYNVTAKGKAYAGASTKAAVLDEIYKQRCIELYMSNLKLEDSRRFGRPNPGLANAERNRDFYPYPLRERNNNINTPADPAQ